MNSYRGIKAMLVLFPRWLVCIFIILTSLKPGFSQTPFDIQDLNGDRFLSRQEFKGPPKAFGRLDRDLDGKISFEEAQGTPLSFQKRKPQEKISPGPRSAAPIIEAPPVYVDTHNHLVPPSGKGRNHQYDYGPAQAAIQAMDANGVKINLIMPMPQGTEQEHRLFVDDLLPVLEKYPGRFALLGGGENLNVIIQKAVQGGEVTNAMVKEFDAEATELIRKGVVGFGEMTAEHVSMKSDHPYVSAPPDHELFLRLADLAAKHGIPIDMHMESIPEDMPLPPHLDQTRNPRILKANIPRFERLLRHNRKANIVWVHMGWDNTGKRTVEQARALLREHPNLHISLRVASGMQAKRVAMETFPFDDSGQLKQDWLTLFQEFPDRFLMGSDEIIIKGSKHPSAGSIQSTFDLLRQLPEDLKRKFGFENAHRLYHLK